MKQFGSANMDVSSLDSEVFPMEDLMLNMQFRPARISIPPQVLLEEVSKSSSEGKYIVFLLQLAITELGSHSPKLETGMKLTSYGEPQMKCSCMHGVPAHSNSLHIVLFYHFSTMFRSLVNP